MQRLEKLRFALIGGGEGAFIGAVHRLAAEMDGHATLVAGCFSSDAGRSVRSGQTLYGLDERRCYGSVADLIAGERSLSEENRAQFAIIATPNHTHYPLACALLDGGFHVVCDKPLAVSTTEAVALEEKVRGSGLTFAVTYNYSGYPMVREARALIASGALGDIRRAQVEYLQGWLSLAEESSGNKQAEWRTDPQRSGAAGCYGDIGSHAEHLLRFVTGLEIESLCADLSAFVPGRALDDDGNVLVRFKGGARGTICASQIAIGEENAVSFRVYGTKGGVFWSQEDANSLIVRWPDRPYEVRRTGGAGTTAGGNRVPSGHPEGYLEAFGNVYQAFFAKLAGDEAEDLPDVTDGLQGLRFIERVVASSNAGGVWLPLTDN